MMSFIKLIYSHIIFFIFGPKIELYEFDPTANDSRVPSQDWNKYLRRISKEPYGKPAADFWENVSGYNVALPCAGTYENEDIMQFSWDENEHHIDVDIFHDGSFEWYYRNRKTEEECGGEQRSVKTLLSQEFIAKLRLIRKRD